MKKKATLLLQHLETIYTMVPPQYMCIHHGFIAFHHEHILAIGQGEGWDYVDKDTRIIEGRNHIAVPGFIDVSIQVDTPTPSTLSTSIRMLREQGEIRMKNGTLIGNCITPMQITNAKATKFLSSSYEFDYTHIQDPTYPIILPLVDKKMKPYKRFCISTGQKNCLDQLLCAKLYYFHTSVDAIHVLSACTIQPARALHLSRYGCIKKGYIGNVLVMEGQSFEEILSAFHGTIHMQVIKEGIRILPNIII